MIRVGVRELRDNLSRYLRRVKEGDRIEVTDRGAAVALLLPVTGGDGARATWFRLIEEGAVAWSGGKPSGAEERIALQGPPLADAVLEDRG